MPIIEVTLLEGRTPEQKADLMLALTEAAVESIGALVESVRVILREVPAEHFGVAGVSIASRKTAGSKIK